MTQNSVARKLHRIYYTENQLLNNHKHSECEVKNNLRPKKGQQ